MFWVPNSMTATWGRLDYRTSAPRAMTGSNGIAGLKVPQKRYEDSLLTDVDKAGTPVVQLPTERVLAIKGTAAAGFIDKATGRLPGAEVPGVIVFAETY